MTQTRARAANGAADANGLRILKKYPNRRLYDTRTSSYITLADVKQMVLGNDEFVVRDAKSGEDLTRSILLQIILEEETAGMPMFSTPMLAHIIRLYGHTMQGLMGSYLEKNIQTFMDLQKQLMEQSGMGDAKSLTPEAWTQFVNVNSPMMQGLMTSYLDQSKKLFAQMQEQMQQQSSSFFQGMPGFGKK
jgi:polyhydroxyalkanoate synthesis repressor PhaR